jgi:Uncharacterised nucleotidyltransferase
MSKFPLPLDAQLLIRALRDVRALRGLSPETWDRFLRCARLTGVLSRLATQIADEDLWSEIPEEVHWHLRAEERVAEHFRQRILWELDRLQAALTNQDSPLVLLKGAAYLAAGLPPAVGRVSSDIDLLVSKDVLSDVETRLLDRGWQSLRDDASLHTAYYLRWLHELPPLAHRHRGVVLDLHHNILPLRDPIQVSAERLIQSSIPLPNRPPFRILAPVDQVLHSATHLFRIGDFDRGLRDLCDMHQLIVHYIGMSPDFTEELIHRAAEMNLGRPCYLAFRYLREHFETPITESTWKIANRFEPSGLLIRWYDKHIRRALFPVRLDGEDHAREWSLWVLDKFPLPRIRSMLSPLFWIKRLPMAGTRA